jgi:hypothetical protein
MCHRRTAVRQPTATLWTAVPQPNVPPPYRSASTKCATAVPQCVNQLRYRRRTDLELESYKYALDENIVRVFIFIFFYSTSYILPDDGKVCTAETCSCFTCIIKQCIDCKAASLLNICILEQKGIYCIETFCPKLHKMLIHFIIEWSSEILAEFDWESGRKRRSVERGTDGRIILKRMTYFVDYILLAV